MAVENETADQVVKMVLQGSEVVLRLTGEAAVRIATLIYNALKGDHTTAGRATLWEFLRSGKDQKVFQIPDEYLKAFTTASKKYGFPFVMLKDKNSQTGLTDVMVYATDASKVNRVIENLQLTVQKVPTLKPEVKLEGSTEYVKPLGMQLKVPLNLIDNIPEEPTDKRLLAELQKLAAKMKTSGPQIVDPVGLLCKENGHYEILPGEGHKRLMAMRIAGYTTAVAEISVPKNHDVEVIAENIDGRPSRERADSPAEGIEPAPLEKASDTPSKEEGQTINPTMARTTKEPAFGHDFEKSSTQGETTMSTDRKSVRAELERCRKISENREAIRAAKRATRAMTKKKNSPK